jgi:two-component sensor histidine kinase
MESDADPKSRPKSDSADLRELLHRLSNQLGVILAHAELLEAKAPDEPRRARAAQIVNAAIDAMATTREIRQRVTSAPNEKVGA